MKLSTELMGCLFSWKTLFLEELTKTVVERAIAGAQLTVTAPTSPAIPATLHASLMARLDRLGSATKEIAQLGAAIGREFSYELLALVSQRNELELREAVGRLVSAGLAFRRGVPPQATFLFKHALVQEAAHSTLLRGSRRQLHAHIAETLEAHFPELLDSQPERFAQHYTEAGLAEKSVAFWGKAGQRSAARSAMAEAAAQLQKGLDQLSQLPDATGRQQQKLEFWTALCPVLNAAKGSAAPETVQAYAQARELWERLGSPSEFIQIPYGQSRSHLNRGEFEQALRLDEDLLRLSRRRNDTGGLVLGHAATGANLMLTGRFTISRSHLERVLELYDPLIHHSLVHQAEMHPQNYSQSLLGIALFCLGFPEKALARSSAAIAEARRLNYLPSLALSLSYGARLLSLDGDNAILGECMRELVTVATEQRFPLWRAHGAILRGWLNVKNGDVAGGYRFCGAV